MSQVTIQVSVTDYLLIMQGLRDRIEELQERAKFCGIKELVEPDLNQCDRLHKELMLNYVGEESFHKLTEEGFFTSLYGGVV